MQAIGVPEPHSANGSPVTARQGRQTLLTTGWALSFGSPNESALEYYQSSCLTYNEPTVPFAQTSRDRSFADRELWESRPGPRLI